LAIHLDGGPCSLKICILASKASEIIDA
jgi:hypothetical protein